MRIINLTSENVKRLKCVSITPTTDTVILGGKNGSGKSSCIDSIQMAIAGADSIPDKPIRKGQTKAEIVLDLGEIVVTRKFTQAGGSTLVVKTKEGVSLPSPQSVLDKLTSRITFDPLSFLRMKPTEQRQSLQALVGLDFAALDHKRKTLFDERTIKNREVGNQEARLKGIVVPENAPDDQISVEALAVELKEANKSNVENTSQRATLQNSARLIEAKAVAIDELTLRIEALKKQLAGYEANYTEDKSKHEALAARVSELKDIETSPIVARIQSAQATNSAVAAKKQKARETEVLTTLRKQSEELTRSIDRIDGDKQEKLANTKFPVPGLSFDETGVLYNGLPFDQASGAEQLRVSVAMGIALHPKLKVLLIRDGSLLDDESLKVIQGMAIAEDVQIWLERVSQGSECSVILEDGEIKDSKPAEEPEKMLV